MNNNLLHLPQRVIVPLPVILMGGVCRLMRLLFRRAVLSREDRKMSAEIVNVFDVVAYLLQKSGEMTAMKLQKLVYYCQAWSLVWDEVPLFTERIEAWSNGPVVRELFEEHKGKFRVDELSTGNSKKLSPMQIETIDAVLRDYGKKPSRWLSDLTHSEKPWQDARQGVSDSARGDAEITHASMAEYYENLPPS